MTMRKVPSPIELMADLAIRGSIEAGAGIVVFDEALGGVLFSDAGGRSMLGLAASGGGAPASASPTMRQVRSALRTLQAQGAARVLLRSPSRAVTRPVAAQLALRPASEARTAYAVLTIPEARAPGDAAEAMLADAGLADVGAGAVFAGGVRLAETPSFDAAAVEDLAERIAAFEAGGEDIAVVDDGSATLTLARAAFGHVLVLVAPSARPAVEAPEAEAPPASGFAGFSVKRPKLGRRPGPSRIAMSMSALVQRWHSRGPLDEDAAEPQTGTPGDPPAETGEPPLPAEAAPAAEAGGALDGAPASLRPARLRSAWGAPAPAASERPAGAEPQADADLGETAHAATGVDGPVEPDVETPAALARHEAAALDASRAAGPQASDSGPETATLLGGEPSAGPEPAEAGAETSLQPGAADAAARPFAPRFDVPPVRFVWQIDRDGGFRFLSPDFTAAVGPRAADVIGRSFSDVARVFGFDAGGEIGRLLERRDTWSGRSILWPVEGSDRKVPVDLAALPVYGRDRSFDGFRGFGIVRMNEAVVDEEALGLVLSGNVRPAGPVLPVEPVRDAEAMPEADAAVPEGDPSADDDAGGGPQPEQKPFLRTFEADRPGGAFGRRTETPQPFGEAGATSGGEGAPKVIRLEERRRPREGALSQAEEAAFRAIGVKLGSHSEAESPGALRFEDLGPPPEPDASRPEATDAPTAAEGEAEPDMQTHAPTADEAEDEVPDEAFDPRPEPDAAAGPEPEAPAAILPEALPPQPAADLPDADAETLPSAGAGTATADGSTGEEECPAEAQAPHEAEAPESEAPDADQTADVAVFEDLFGLLPLPVLVQAQERLVYANAEFRTLTGYADAAALEAAGGLDALIVDGAGPSAGAVTIRRADGQTLDVGAHMQRIAGGGRSALLVSFTQVHAPQAGAAEAAAVDDLRQEVEELQAVLDTATDGVVLLDTAGAIRAMNGSAHALFGIGQNEALGRHLSSLFAHESQKATLDYLEMLRDDGIGGILNDGREVIGRVAQGGFIPLFITIGRLSGERGWCVVIRDIAHWKRIEEDLVNARRQAEAASLHKSRFLANISHELRTPLNAIIGFADVMASECFGPIGNERYLEYLGDIKRSGHHVLDLVNDLLDISKIEAGKLDLSFEAVSLNEVVSEVVSLMQPQANRERVIVRSNLPSSVPPVVADRRTMRQIALNLVANAIRFTPAGGQIIASTTYTAEGDVLLRFRDSGIGMTEREIEIALTPFQQVHAPSANRGEGTGLGLPLTKAMVEANRAQFAIHSTPGEGTLVEIAFPAPRVLAD